MRLVDADELIEHAWRDKLDSRELIVEMITKASTIKEIPTKIPINIFERLFLQEPKWIPVSEKLPDDETDVLVCNKDGKIELTSGSKSTEVDDFIWYVSGWRFGDVVAWMPLPIKPYESQESEDKE